MSDYLAASRYARALFEIVKPMGQDEKVEAELVEMADVIRKNSTFQKNIRYSV